MNINDLIIKYNELSYKNNISSAEYTLKDKILEILKKDHNIIYEIRNNHNNIIRNFKCYNQASHFLFFVDSESTPHRITIQNL